MSSWCLGAPALTSSPPASSSAGSAAMSAGLGCGTLNLGGSPPGSSAMSPDSAGLGCVGRTSFICFVCILSSPPGSSLTSPPGSYWSVLGSPSSPPGSSRTARVPCISSCRSLCWVPLSRSIGGVTPTSAGTRTLGAGPRSRYGRGSTRCSATIRVDVSRIVATAANVVVGSPSFEFFFPP